MARCRGEEQAVAWALHALEPDEEQQVRDHLAGCADCRETVRETEETLAALGGAVEQSAPPPGLRDRILDEAARTPQGGSAPRGAAAATGRSGGAGTGPAGSRGGGPGRPARHARRRGLRGRLAAAAVAAVVALGAIAGLGVYSAQLRTDRDAEVARAQGLVELVQQLSTPGTAHAFLTSGSGDEVVAAVMARGAQQMVLPVALPANPGDHVYVLWGLPGAGSPAPLGTFDVTTDTSGIQSVGSSPDGAGFAQFAISLEPGRAAPASPSDVVASGRVET